MSVNTLTNTPGGVFILNSVKFITQTNLAPKDTGAMGRTVSTGRKKVLLLFVLHIFLHCILSGAQFMARPCTIWGGSSHLSEFKKNSSENLNPGVFEEREHVILFLNINLYSFFGNFTSHTPILLTFQSLHICPLPLQ